MQNHKYFKIGFISIFSIVLVMGIFYLNDYLSTEKRWFYATGSEIKAFGNLYWGMSKQEVERTLGAQLHKKINLDFPGVIVNETTSDFKNRYENKYEFPYSPEIDNGISIFKISKPQNIFGVNINDFDVWFFDNKLYKIELTTRYISNTKLINDELRIGLVNELNKKYNLLNKNSTEWNDFKLYPDAFVVEGLLNNNIGIFMQFYSNKLSGNTNSVIFSLALKNISKIKEIKEKIKSHKPDFF